MIHRSINCQFHKSCTATHIVMMCAEEENLDFQLSLKQQEGMGGEGRGGEGGRVTIELVHVLRYSQCCSYVCTHVCGNLILPASMEEHKI